MHALAEARVCPDCRFYRSEAPPPRGSTGPPYGLLQGSLSGLPAIPPPEGGMVAKRGHVALIPHTKVSVWPVHLADSMAMQGCTF